MVANALLLSSRLSFLFSSSADAAQSEAHLPMPGPVWPRKALIVCLFVFSNSLVTVLSC